MKNSIKMSILPLLVCLSLNGKALADSSVELPLSCNEVNYQDYIQSSAKTQKLIAETGKGCNLRGAYLIEADLRGAILTEADLTEADLTGANLKGSNLRDADLTGADFTRADLTDADLTGVNLKLADLRGALYNDETMFPEGFDPVESGMSRVWKTFRRGQGYN